MKGHNSDIKVNCDSIFACVGCYQDLFLKMKRLTENLLEMTKFHKVTIP